MQIHYGGISVKWDFHTIEWKISTSVVIVLLIIDNLCLYDQNPHNHVRISIVAISNKLIIILLAAKETYS